MAPPGPLNPKKSRSCIRGVQPLRDCGSAVVASATPNTATEKSETPIRRRDRLVYRKRLKNIVTSGKLVVIMGDIRARSCVGFTLFRGETWTERLGHSARVRVRIVFSPPDKQEP